MILIFSTLANKKEARKIGKGLLKKKLIACYNLFPVESSYWWKGKIIDDKEVLMILKTKKESFEKVEKFILQNSSYKTPEILSIEPNQVTEKYLKWVKDVV